MNKEIKEILDYLKIENGTIGSELSYEETHLLLEYITNLQTIEREYSAILSENAELQQRIEGLEAENETLRSDFKNQVEYTNKIAEEKDRLKEVLNCKEYFSSTMPEDVEFVILTKENYDRQQKDIQLELIDYKLRCEKAIEYFKYQLENLDFYEDTKARMLCAMGITLLQNGGENQ